MGAQPGDCIDSNTFTLPSHESESLSAQQSAERISQHFASISQEFPPLDVNNLPARVRTKLLCTDTPPAVTEYEAYRKIIGAKTVTGEWPSSWKLEHVVPIGKMTSPETEDDLRPISLTPFFSKVTEHFVVGWLMSYIKDKIDFRQYGGQKGNSITHYLIEFITFILSCQDSTDQTAILAVMVDFSKAFNRQNHNLLIIKLSDMGVPAWLLRVVIGFLKDRHMVLRYKGKLSKMKYLPGGGPQGTLLGLLLFIILINDVGFEDQKNNLGDILTSKRNMKHANEILLKYVDDLTLAEAINLPSQLVSDPNRLQPDCFHGRTGHVLPETNSLVCQQLVKTADFAEQNDMKINNTKTKAMLFNACKSIDFMPKIRLENHEVEVVEEIKLLGITIRSDLKWSSITQNLVQKANKRLWIIRRLSLIHI